MPIVQRYRDCKCVKDCYDTFNESVHYSYYPLMPGQVGVMDNDYDTLYIMTEELFWENFTDPKREYKHRKNEQKETK